MEHETIISEVGHLLDKLEALVQSGRRLPWGRQVLVDEDAIRTTIEHLRHTLPEEVRQAQWIIQERDRIIQEAGRDADHLVSEAVHRAHALADDSEVGREASERASEMVRQAQMRATEIHQGALAYADDMLARLEADLGRLHATVRQNRQDLHPRESAANE